VSVVVLFSTAAVGVTNLAVLVDWLMSEIVEANRLIDFHRAHPGVIIDRFDGGMVVTAAYATGRTMLVSLVLAIAYVVVALVVRIVRWLRCEHDRVIFSAE
jgi:hypothetical protein